MSIHEYGAQVDVRDPWADPETVSDDGIVLAVVHGKFRHQGAEALRRHGRGAALFCDLKSTFAPQDSDLRL